MSKKAKKAAKEKRLARKRAIKMANKAKYQAWARAGENTKSKRFRKKKKSFTFEDHKDGYCGNVACRKCFPDIARPNDRKIPSITLKEWSKLHKVA